MTVLSFISLSLSLSLSFSVSISVSLSLFVSLFLCLSLRLSLSRFSSSVVSQTLQGDPGVSTQKSFTNVISFLKALCLCVCVGLGVAQGGVILLPDVCVCVCVCVCVRESVTSVVMDGLCWCVSEWLQRNTKMCVCVCVFVSESQGACYCRLCVWLCFAVGLRSYSTESRLCEVTSFLMEA